MVNESTPLLPQHHHPDDSNFWDFGDHQDDDLHTQFCKLVGIPPFERIRELGQDAIPYKSLYGRATRLKTSQQKIYLFTAALTNTLLLSQVVLGAALTALGASASSHILITFCGAANTVIAGLVAYLKSRGQPVRARMFRDDLARVVDEIDNSETMWRGVSMGIHGYDEIDTDDQVTIRTEIARLTRLYDKAVRTNALNSPDQYQNDGSQAKQATLKSRRTMSMAGPYAQQPRDVLRLTMNDPDRSPASAPPITINAPELQQQFDHGHEQVKADNHTDLLDPKSAGVKDGEQAVASAGADDPSPVTDIDKVQHKHNHGHKRSQSPNQSSRAPAASSR